MTYLFQEIRFFFSAWLHYFRDAKALRGSFLMHLFGMALSNIAFFVIWMMFIQATGDIKGWGVLEVFGMLSTSVLSFGISVVLFGTLFTWLEVVPDGRLDVFLTKPKSLYMRLICQKIRMGAFGDLLQGLLCVCVFFYLVHPSWSDVSIYFLMLIPSSMAFVGFFMTVSCLIFLFPQAPQIIKPFLDLFFIPTLQPISLIEGPLRFVYLVLVPALLVSGLPMEVLKEFSWAKVLIAYAVAFGWIGLSILVLRFSLRRYESSNVPN